MPTFYPEHDNPAGHNLDSFTRGYLGAAEWLAKVWAEGRDDNDLTDDERARCRGFTRAAIAEAKRDCKAFQKANKADMATYYEISGKDEDHAGLDYWLSRNGHGAGYFDRGDGGAFDRLQEMARLDGARECVLYRNRLVFESC
ncbi:hypothetical protein UFOVP786_21 [uncultured Caudovirales phage]|uniref:Uncharacterized protein n=1 Tax=uncultured Caudovirales phage TaxID=2100421 RepID=A0A6J5NST6_9CAUD|nr:hypothetical protein UFOVP786_21 [uncultured Caudovirales phage]